MPATTRASIVRGRLRRARFVRRPTLSNPYDPLGLFGDGPPAWIINKGKLGQRPSSSAAEAMRQRDATTFKLRWHAKHAALLAGKETTTSLATSALADKLDTCAPPKRPCLSGACPSCIRAQQRWQVRDTMLVLRRLLRDPNYRPQVLSLVPECGQIPVGSLNAFDIDRFLNSVRDALAACGIDHYKLGLDVSLNERAGLASTGFWQLHMWGFFHEPKRRWREQLKALLNPNGGATRPVKVKKPDSLEAAAAYGVKDTFVRRVSYRKANLNREDRGECGNTRGRILRGDAWVELQLFLDRIGLQRRLCCRRAIYRLRRCTAGTALDLGAANDWLRVRVTTPNVGDEDNRSSRRSCRRWNPTL